MITLADYFNDKSLRVAGRLDKDSEGLLLLTDSGTLNHFITTPPPISKSAKKWGKTYLAQVENSPTSAQLQALRDGVILKDGKTLPAIVKHLSDEDLPITLWQRNPPIRERKTIPTAWLSITIFEGKNRQIRRMTAHVGLPCLRLIRYQIGTEQLGWNLDGLALGESRKICLSHDELSKLIKT